MLIYIYIDVRACVRAQGWITIYFPKFYPRYIACYLFINSCEIGFRNKLWVHPYADISLLIKYSEI